VRANLEAVGLADGPVTLVQATLPGWLLTGAGRFDLALCDPPYDFGGWTALLGALRAAVAVLESATPSGAGEEKIVPPEGWVVTKTRHYGGTLVTVVRRDESE
jgi:16S rRNA G966 N2-methylase RsmD